MWNDSFSLGGKHLLCEASVCAPYFGRMGELNGLACHLPLFTVTTLRHIQVRHRLASHQETRVKRQESGAGLANEIFSVLQTMR
jgi:hypothetical protein